MTPINDHDEIPAASPLLLAFALCGVSGMIVGVLAGMWLG